MTLIILGAGAALWAAFLLLIIWANQRFHDGLRRRAGVSKEDYVNGKVLDY
jgi:hypothetical protein